jgi:3-hydroxyisobutyrate dehydrogenase-like beta-hydroxyacid dehydrogenase
MKSKGTVGVIGLGIMGGAFAGHLAKAGWRVVGYDVDAKRCRALARLGGEIAADAAAVAKAAPTIITSLPKPAALEETVQAIAKAGIKAGVKPRVIVEMSTFALDDKLAAERVLAKAGHVMLDCPVSGTGSQAKTKDIVVYASGERKAIKRLRPLFGAFARGLHDLGAFGNGSRMKYVANLLVAINNVASAEAMVLGMKAGLDPQLIHDMVTSGAGNSRVFELRAPMMVKGRYDDATMKIAVWQKDMQVIGATRPVYGAAMAGGHALHDTAAVCDVLEKMAGVRRGKKRRKQRS